MTARGLKDIYFTWLCDKIAIEYGRQTDKSYGDLLGQLHSKEFVWVVPNDDNRIADGQDLRARFYYETSLGDDHELAGLPVSVLEVIVALGNRLEFISNQPASIWSWRLIENLELHKFSDPISPREQNQIDDILEALIWRTYKPDGSGGLFPLAFPQENQTKVEVWYQMHHFLEEQSPEEN